MRKIVTSRHISLKISYQHSNQFVWLCTLKYFLPYDSLVEFGFHYNTLLSIMYLILSQQ
jgi:hypothetical protein